MSEPYKKIATREREEEQPQDKKMMRMWYVVNAKGQPALRRNWRFTVSSARRRER
jgi:hypothetical protein